MTNQTTQNPPPRSPFSPTRVLHIRGDRSDHVRVAHAVVDLHHELEQLNHAMSDPDRAGDMDTILARFGEVQEEYEHLGGYALEAKAREVLSEGGAGAPAADKGASVNPETPLIFPIVSFVCPAGRIEFQYAGVLGRLKTSLATLAADAVLTRPARAFDRPLSKRPTSTALTAPCGGCSATAFQSEVFGRDTACPRPGSTHQLQSRRVARTGLPTADD